MEMPDFIFRCHKKNDCIFVKKAKEEERERIINKMHLVMIELGFASVDTRLLIINKLKDNT